MAELTYESAFPGRFTKAALFEGKHVTLTIARAFMEELEGEKGKENKLIAGFKETPKELVICKTNAFCLKEMFGSKISAWIGKRVTFFPTKVPFGPKQVDAIRVAGSPDISGEVEVSARIGRKQFKATLTRTSVGKQESVKPSGVTRQLSPIGEKFELLMWSAERKEQFYRDNIGKTEDELNALLEAELDKE